MKIMYCGLVQFLGKYAIVMFTCTVYVKYLMCILLLTISWKMCNCNVYLYSVCKIFNVYFVIK